MTVEAQVQDVDPLTLKTWLAKGEALLVDVRWPAFRQEVIAGARSIPVSAMLRPKRSATPSPCRRTA